MCQALWPLMATTSAGHSFPDDWPVAMQLWILAHRTDIEGDDEAERSGRWVRPILAEKNPGRLAPI